jgi:hypothetical protein
VPEREDKKIPFNFYKKLKGKEGGAIERDFYLLFISFPLPLSLS